MNQTNETLLSRAAMKAIKGGGPQTCLSQGNACMGAQGTGVCVPHGNNTFCYCSIPGYPIEWPCPNPV